MKSFIEEKEDCACYAGQPIDNTKEDLLQALKEAFEEMVSERAEKLLENDLELGVDGVYYEGHDKDFVDVGVGSVCVRDDILQDEDQAFEDAKEEIISELVNNEEDAPYYLFENNKFTIALGKFLKGC